MEPDVQARIKDLGLIADPSSGAAFRERMKQRPSVRQVLEFEGLVEEEVAG